MTRVPSSARTALLLAAVLVSACDCGRDSAGPADASPPVDLGVHDTGPSDAGLPRPAPDLGSGVVTTRVAIPNARGELVDTVFAAPTTAGPFPAVFVAHGSGGLFRMPESGDTGTCSDRLEAQFARWAVRLVSMGFVVAMPDSFGPRGYCDFNDDPRRDVAYPPIAADTDGKTRRLVDRMYDADAVLRVLAARADVRADRIGLLGFSNGASVVSLYLHHRLPAAFAEFAASDDGQALGVTFPPWPASTVPVVTAIAYYPGCGFDGLLPFSTASTNLASFYYPSAPLRIQHASLDPLLDHCSTTQTGTRELQADGYASAMSLPDRYDVTIYDGASHGFDAADCELLDAGTDPDLRACAEALPVTLGLLAPLGQN